MVLPIRLFVVTSICIGIGVWVVPALAVCTGRDLMQGLADRTPTLAREIEEADAAMPYRVGRLFAIRRGHGPTSHVFATIHAGVTERFAVPPAAAAALRASRVLLLELAGRERSARTAVLPRAAIQSEMRDRAASLLSAEDFRALRRSAERRGISPEALGTLGAGVLALMLGAPACAAESGSGTRRSVAVEDILGQLAAEHGLAVVGLESLAEQIRSVSELAPSVERAFLIAVIRQAEREGDILETTLRRYREGRLGAMLAWMSSREPLPGQPDSQLPAIVLDRLLNDRSARLVERALPHLASGGAFVAVGAAHLPGRKGILNRLAELGFTIEMIE